MRIGILTLPLRSNYGGILQCYALQTVLEKMGHDVIVLDRRFPAPGLRLFMLRCGSMMKCIVRKLLLHQDNVAIVLPWDEYYVIDKTLRTDTSELKDFIRKNIHLSRALRSTKELARQVRRQHLDCIIVGSDQVWRECYSPCITDYFLGFLQDDDKMLSIAYAASFGTADRPIGNASLDVCSGHAGRFRRVSVREMSGISLFREISGRNAELVLDPTLLLEPMDYMFNDLCSAAPMSGKLVSYILDKSIDKDRIADDVSLALRLPEKRMTLAPRREDGTAGKMIPVPEWVFSISSASFVVTDSFHGCVFSILWQRPFVAIVNSARGADRFVSLLSQLGLEGRMVRSHDEFTQRREELLVDVDFSRAARRLKELKASSLGFLKEALDHPGF